MTAKDYLNRPFILNNKINDKKLSSDFTENYRAVHHHRDSRSIFQAIKIQKLPLFAT